MSANNHSLSASVVLYHNTQGQIEKLLNSFTVTSVQLELFLIDNSPEKHAFIKLEKLPEFVRYLPQGSNLGYGVAHNLAILGKNQGAYHLICNPDVYFEPIMLAQMLRFMDSHKSIGLLMPKVVWPDNTDQGLRKLLPTPFDLFVRRFLPSFLQGLTRKQMKLYQLEHLNAAKSMLVPVLSGCFMLCRASVLQSVKGFDPRFFLYLEDVDLSRRMNEKAVNLYWPTAQVTHEYQKDSYKSLNHLLKHLKSAVQYFNKHGWFIDKSRKHINEQAIFQNQDALPYS